ncbi:hypothetical protein FRB98_003496, partial [Tulasnella sp. 332]
AWKLMLDLEEMTQERWTFFLQNYSNRVRSLEVDFPLHLDSLALLKKLSETFGGRLGSGISTLDATHLEYRDNHSTPLIDLLLGPNLREIGLPNYANTLLVPILIAEIKRRAPHVIKLTVMSIDRSIDYSGFSRLRTLSHVGIISPSDYLALSNCQYLQILRVEEWADQSLTSTWLPITTIPIFPSLHELRVHVYSTQLEDLIFRSITPCLQTVAFRCFNRQLDVLAFSLFFHRCTFLNDLVIELNLPREELAKMGHGNVRRLRIDNWEYMSRDSQDDEFNWIGPSYPEVRELTLGCGAHYRKRSEWGILASLLPTCNKLEKLSLHLHISTFTLSDVTSFNTPPLLSLTTLRLQTLQIGTTFVDEFAQYLAMTFPNVSTFEVNKFYETLITIEPPEGGIQGNPQCRLFSEEEKELFIGNFHKYQKAEMPSRMD